MAYDEELTDRVRAALAREDGLSERKMFGGLAFMLNVEREGLDDAELRGWVEQAAAFARDLPPKQPK